MDKPFSTFAAEESLTSAEAKLLLDFLRAIRKAPTIGGTKERAISYDDVLTTMAEQARLLEAHMESYGLKSEQAENLDAGANILRAVVGSSEARSAVAGFGARVNAARWGRR
jgi:hypothetical protein